MIKGHLNIITGYPHFMYLMQFPVQLFYAPSINPKKISNSTKTQKKLLSDGNKLLTTEIVQNEIAIKKLFKNQIASKENDRYRSKHLQKYATIQKFRKSNFMPSQDVFQNEIKAVQTHFGLHKLKAQVPESKNFNYCYFKKRSLI